jgi:hypothetical protein
MTMGEAKRRRSIAAANPVIYHHTSTLRTNLIWMSGKIEIESDCGFVPHPQLGKIGTDASLGRGMVDFPPVAGLTTKATVPHCLQQTQLSIGDEKIDLPPEYANAITLNLAGVVVDASAVSSADMSAAPGAKAVPADASARGGDGAAVAGPAAALDGEVVVALASAAGGAGAASSGAELRRGSGAVDVSATRGCDVVGAASSATGALAEGDPPLACGAPVSAASQRQPMTAAATIMAMPIAATCQLDTLRFVAPPTDLARSLSSSPIYFATTTVAKMLLKRLVTARISAMTR